MAERKGRERSSIHWITPQLVQHFYLSEDEARSQELHPLVLHADGRDPWASLTLDASIVKCQCWLHWEGFQRVIHWTAFELSISSSRQTCRSPSHHLHTCCWGRYQNIPAPCDTLLCGLKPTLPASCFYIVRHDSLTATFTHTAHMLRHKNSHTYTHAHTHTRAPHSEWSRCRNPLALALKTVSSSLHWQNWEQSKPDPQRSLQQLLSASLGSASSLLVPPGASRCLQVPPAPGVLSCTFSHYSALVVTPFSLLQICVCSTKLELKVTQVAGTWAFGPGSTTSPCAAAGCGVRSGTAWTPPGALTLIP